MMELVEISGGRQTAPATGIVRDVCLDIMWDAHDAYFISCNMREQWLQNLEVKSLPMLM